MHTRLRFAILGTLALAASATPALAQRTAPPPPAPLQAAIGDPEDFTLRASARLRYEVLDGQPRAGFRQSEQQLDLRSTLFAEYDPGVIRIGSELYDSRAWLTRPGTTLSTGEVNTFELVQAYVGGDLADALGEGSSLGLQAGRFTLNLGSRRLVAADDYRNSTNGYTGLRTDASLPGGVTLTGIYVLP
ncbi:MAG: alginate export family protein, partial [Pseudomonadota bacterium]